MKKLTKTIALGIIASALAGSFALASDTAKRGPLPFSTFDTNKDGTISEDELMLVREKFRAANSANKPMMEKSTTAPTFAMVDTDKNGKISKTEFASAQGMHHRKDGGGIGWGSE